MKGVKGITAGGLLLRARLFLMQASPVALVASVVIVLSVANLLRVLHGLSEEETRRLEAGARAAAAARLATASTAARPSAAAAPAPVPAPLVDPLDAFYGTLGQRRYAERQVKTLFGLAAQNGLTLSQGEYKSGWDRNARVHTYQVNLPVKGSYAAIWQFAMAALRAIPFAALDDISFRRDSIGDPAVEARLRLTFYLTDAGSAP